ncbi:MAG: protein-L-isoaspartate O-methyltransferase [Hydrogenophilales bacterium CG03_land_8_20_14_0_80_62_28]|nr:protein-L-isoaspartate O-methyltransferase [Betaproteobacteria bacterium]OIO78011.1 MAG: protein-L-isoaspartate O-methyltransferase [Hydrogenophilaceae bacterium CG1_02_62_390]PIV21705.1 MAG: protein-L-isoaspartate O-methyltransferase [Hydrogenophilales bacterium CG03_land_8_20_14_0_80_62_28]PIW38977.1 MAG: protein-L-isoaspartate O-methyltransferase [Hydrogenophilales bacterium CG15_BIG_FIL_POST_REV_8_21_14_020_62_31]PIW71408.1 MAG: protein-L-isoaspartate O-methyltransferase [Hydrogenophilal
MDYENARHLMIEQQIRPWEVLDPVVLDLLTRLKREDFVPAIYRSLAFVDMAIPLGNGEAMWEPKLEARVVQNLALKRTDRVLEVGAGSGYLTALLASLAAEVVSIEIDPELKETAEKTLKAHGLENVTVKLGDAARDWNADGRFDAIVLTGSSPVLPEAYLNRLNPGGRLFAVVGEGPAMAALLVTCAGPGACRREVLFETSVKALVHALEPERFVF